VRDRDPGVAARFIVISGDTAFSGLDEQYTAAVGFLGELKDELASYSNNGAEVGIVAILGNHDCDFEAADVVRKRLLDNVEADPDQASDEGIIVYRRFPPELRIATKSFRQ
jgi:predicted MPP superfamily phosphohydrolase